MDGYIAEIRFFAGDFAPQNWLLCQGQLLNISSNTALFALLGFTYGGNGTTTFGIPDFRGRIPVGIGTGPGLNTVDLGERGGAETVTLLTSNLPPHTHNLLISGVAPLATASDGDSVAPGPTAYPAVNGTTRFSTTGTATMNLSNNLVVSNAGSGIPVSKLMPSLGMNFIICQFGIFPSRN